MNNFIKILTDPKTKGIISVVAAVVMYYTPDQIDTIIEGLLGAFGISQFMIIKKD